MSDLRYLAPPLIGDYDTRHEAIGKLTRFDEWDDGEIVPIHEDVLVRLQRYPEHLGNKHFGDRDYLATTHGTVKIDRESLVRFWNGSQQEVVESHYELECPVCYELHESDGTSEDDRRAIIDELLDCCGIEWWPPSDWVADCEVCGDSHRGEFACSPPAFRDPFPGVDNDYGCARCGWDGHGEDLQGPYGECPNCDSGAVRVVSA